MLDLCCKCLRYHTSSCLSCLMDCCNWWPPKSACSLATLLRSCASLVLSCRRSAESGCKLWSTSTNTRKSSLLSCMFMVAVQTCPEPTIDRRSKHGQHVSCTLVTQHQCEAFLHANHNFYQRQQLDADIDTDGKVCCAGLDSLGDSTLADHSVDHMTSVWKRNISLLLCFLCHLNSNPIFYGINLTTPGLELHEQCDNRF